MYTLAVGEKWRSGWRARVLGGGIGAGLALLGFPLMYFFVRYLYLPATIAWRNTDAWWKWPAFVALYAGVGFLLWRFYQRFRRLQRDAGKR